MSELTHARWGPLARAPVGKPAPFKGQVWPLADIRNVRYPAIQLARRQDGRSWPKADVGNVRYPVIQLARRRNS